jgi:hypothetical protein
MKQKSPVGSGTIYKEVDDKFVAHNISANKGNNASKISLHWLNKMQSQFIRDGEMYHISCKKMEGKKLVITG